MPEISTSVSSVVFYRKMGSGPVLILLHGFPESSNVWRNVWYDLAKDFTLIIPDFPGSGDSVLEKDTTIVQMADCVAEIMTHEKVDKAVVAGHSMGGYIALAFAAKYPGKTLGISMVHSTAAADDEEKAKNRLKTIELIRNGGKNAFVRQMVANLFSPTFKEANPEIVKEQINLTLEVADESIINYTQAMIARDDQRFWLKNTSIPVQWIAGMDDNVISYKKILEQSVESGINFVTFYNNCGHMSMLEAPEKLVNDLKEFVVYSYEHQLTL
ncbi:MAG: alpha/beta hydrolase fold protein [Flavipsychrobacter sp.]|jgi:pimeloyl-ACP methyl ester carboxylesterase|nr:alpha/beta hydrolase fold protein [Flavipsychrobacter sp.]